MKSIPYDLKQKLLKNMQVKSTDSQPNLKVIATQSTMNTLLTEIIHNDVDSDYGDIAIRKLPTEKEPSLAYSICIDDGVANIYSRVFPAYIDNPWDFLWELGSADEVAIEFNGKWQIIANEQTYYLATEETPYIFFVNNGNLYVQKWNDETTRTQLAENVGEISACRGWQSSDDMLLDQGLIVGYLRNGKAFYRALCLQESDEYVWETEREITDLGSGNTSICVFRTNDFRVGFISENADGGFGYVLSSRTYAGQSVKSESIYSQIVADCYLQNIPIAYKSVEVQEATTISAYFPPIELYIGNSMSNQTLEILSTSRVNNNQFLIEFNYNLLEKKAIKYFLAIDVDGIYPTIASAEVDENTIIVTTDINISQGAEVDISLLNFSRLCFLPPNSSPVESPIFVANFQPDLNFYCDEQLTLITDFQISLLNKAVVYEETQQSVGSLVSSIGDCIIMATQVGEVPV